jgi:RNA polymerase sigma-70 factor (ECF subfamily)
MSVTQHTRKAAGTETAGKAVLRGPGLLEEAFARHQAELLGTLYYLVGNLEDARDALQEAFVKCWRHQEQVVEVENLKAWIFRIALNTGRDIRETAWRRKRQALPEDEGTLASHAAGPTEIVEHDERLARLRTALKELRPEEQEVFLLRQNGELTYEEIAETIGVPTGTVKTRMRLALARLREALAET